MGRNARVERLTQLIDWTPLETQVADGLIAGEEAAVYGDAAYGTHGCGRPVEPVFGPLKRSYGYQRVRYRGLARNATELWFKLLAYNLRRADRLLTDAPA